MIKIPQIKNKKLLEEALTHRSFLNETKEKVPSNERLEFLGDSILSFIVSDYLFSKYPQFNEGKLTNLRSLLVNTKMLADIASECDLGSKLRLSKGEEEGGGRKNQSLLADTFEAYVGALYLDQGIDEVNKFINSTKGNDDHFLQHINCNLHNVQLLLASKNFSIFRLLM